MSTLCRAEWERRNVRGARPSRSLGGASRAALLDKDVFGGTPNTARETHALPIHFSALQKCRVKGGRKISDLFFCKRIARMGLPRRSPESFRGEAGSGSVKVGQTDLVSKHKVNQALRTACIVILLALAGCTRSEPPADLVMINGPDPETLDPALATGIEDLRVIAALFEGLTRNDPVTAGSHSRPGRALGDFPGWVCLYFSPERQPALDGRRANHGAGRCVFLAARP